MGLVGEQPHQFRQLRPMPWMRAFRASTDVGAYNQETPSAVEMADVVTFASNG
jgi:hypothetical protein